MEFVQKSGHSIFKGVSAPPAVVPVVIDSRRDSEVPLEDEDERPFEVGRDEASSRFGQDLVKFWFFVS